ncbi:MAG: 3-hydroxyacyl-CoA dehydrogenase family protein [Deltaproteobacteria bacterium]|nr:3-hydroxyacyl-CoA dehydrogenase family protein [Deltaproteobacteria bacterium]
MEEFNIKKVAIIGAGLMGFGVGVEFARFGYDVSFYNTSEASSKKAMERAKEALGLMAETQLITANEAEAAYGRLRPVWDLEEAAAGADFVHESALEILEVKQDVFAKLDAICPPPAILATNTSGLNIDDIASATKHPERVVAAHYFQPPHFVPLVEVVGGKNTSPEFVEATAQLLRGLRKKVAVLNFALPGFVGNRIQGVIGREIQSLVDKGVCSPEMIDDIISFGLKKEALSFGARWRNTWNEGNSA